MELSIPLLFASCLACCGWVVIFSVGRERLYLETSLVKMVFLVSQVPLIAKLGAGDLIAELIRWAKH